MSIFSNRINKLADHFGYKTYLEVGVANGDTFLNVRMPHRSAVDPKFRFNTKEHENENTFFFATTSDVFFENMTENMEQIYKDDIIYDIIFIDGLHIFNQAMRDFTNSIPYSHANTIWIFDDTVPCDPYSALPDARLNDKYRQAAGLRRGPWHGDVFKCVFAIHDFYFDFSYATVVGNGNPQTVFWRTNWPAPRKRIYNSLSDIERMSYFDLLAKCAYLNIISDDELVENIGSHFEAKILDPEVFLPKIGIG